MVPINAANNGAISAVLASPKTAVHAADEGSAVASLLFNEDFWSAETESFCYEQLECIREKVELIVCPKYIGIVRTCAACGSSTSNRIPLYVACAEGE